MGGETGVGACTDGTDNDNDHAVDCEDPDCQAEAVCGRAAPLSEPNDGGEPTRPSLPPASPSRPAQDAGGMSEPSPDQLVDAGAIEQAPDEILPDPDNPPDAGADPLKQCPVCEANESCIEGRCVSNDVVFVELWQVTHISTVFPRIFANDTCIDTECGAVGIGTPEFPFCLCMPDPLVRVLVTRPGELPETVAESPFDPLLDSNRDTDDWDMDQQIALRPEYQITLRAIDRDLALEDIIFECTIPADPELLGSGTLSCMQTFKGATGKEFEASITVSIRAANVSTP
jgi:hypothetical protein